MLCVTFTHAGSRYASGIHPSSPNSLASPRSNPSTSPVHTVNKTRSPMQTAIDPFFPLPICRKWAGNDITGVEDGESVRTMGAGESSKSIFKDEGWRDAKGAAKNAKSRAQWQL
ncbi:hypothetical protein Slin15195_G129830 [Septoria linicola]|uniref:Uncharacterized protein n=1 Tax=Septoria linicola TaxID=215465 RepID=A0A9Q9B290_9PEZI|nr:hypothetical protein Slin15195_G129830 [Septoria linicola]